MITINIYTNKELKILCIINYRLFSLLNIVIYVIITGLFWQSNALIRFVSGVNLLCFVTDREIQEEMAFQEPR